MPSAQVQSHGVAPVATFAELLQSFLAHAETVKPSGAIEPALSKADFDDLPGQISRIFADLQVKAAEGADGRKKIRQYAIIETAVRDVFSHLIVSQHPGYRAQYSSHNC